MNNSLKIRNAIIVGAIPAILEGLLVYFADPLVGKWVLIQSILFWFSCGFVVSLADIGYRRIPVSILLTVLLNIPWYIALTIVANKPEHLIPLIISSIVMGTIIGYTSSRLSFRKNTSA
jgi:hypothetical protein